MNPDAMRQWLASQDPEIIVRGGKNHELKGVGLVLDGPEGKGRVLIERSGYGFYVWVDGYDQPLCMIDLFYRSPEFLKGAVEGEPKGFAQVNLYQPENDEPVGSVRWLGDGDTEVRIESTATITADPNGHLVAVEKEDAIKS